MKLLATCACILAIGCTANPQAQPAHIDVQLTDAPAVFDSVFVTISRVEISSAEDSWVTLASEPQRFDLLLLQNDATALLGGADLAPGHYNQLRLIVDSSSVVVGGVEESLTIASGAQSGIKIILDADLVAGVSYTLVIDFDAARSVKSTGHGYLMTPVIKVKSLTAAPTETPPDAADDSPDDSSGDTSDDT